ncbi:Uncharacterised protein [Kingella potus]|uniref:Inhibitor I9 domain-containing protein n=1 Tax=Kingella potus TaxID=265175 RepID=A0A377R4L4_9NEIS|nr:hypothetical protein [Kingella potus]UOO99946.1 hypothetical protein LVJ84_07765 [Kingella potus]STR03209.1 Uncharacterised protein [Kingella potus]
MNTAVFPAAALSFCLAAAACAGNPQPVPTHAAEHPAASRNLIVFYDAQTGSAPLLQAAQAYGAKVVYEYKTMNGFALAVPQGKDMAAAEAYFSKVRGVLGVNRDQKLQLH